ncbi:MAG: TIGR03364 family FAD-dependent oxidoreductase [Cyclobacteriaceae bacterium]
MERSADIAIVGAGIAGLAHAYMALKKGYKVVLFERDQFAVGASIRNFGLLWPIGQAPGVDLDRALRSREIWNDISAEAGLWNNPNGSIQLAYHDDELDIFNEFLSLYSSADYDCEFVTPQQIARLSPGVRQKDLKGGLFSKTESTVNPREAIRRIPLWLEQKYGLILKFGQMVTQIAIPHVKTTRESWLAKKVIICSGAEFQTLYPEAYAQQNFSKCKLQMLKATPSQAFQLGPSLCAGLTLRHYPAFAECRSLKKLDDRYDTLSVKYKTNGIHVLLAQNNYGELIIGDSHHYNQTVEPFDSEEINALIIEYLKSFFDFGFNITERWNGVYPKVPGNHCIVLEPEPNVLIVNGLGGAGMTLSFGLAEEVIERIDNGLA